MNLKKIIPVVSIKNLLFVAAFVWFFAGFMLFDRGINMYLLKGNSFDFKILLSILAGLIFYLAVFRKISDKHIHRILTLDNEVQPFYRFFNKRSYIMMAAMITLGITVRKSGLVPLTGMALFYITMGTPLLISALKFLYFRINQNSRISIKK